MYARIHCNRTAQPVVTMAAQTPRPEWLRALLASKTRLVMGGGAMHGLMYLGALLRLFPTRRAFADWHHGLRTLAGASMGALLAALLCTWTPWQVWAYAKTEQFRSIGSQIVDQSFLDMPTTCSLSSGRALDAALQRGVSDAYGRSDVTLADVRAATGKTLIITVSNVTLNRAEFWSHHTQPDVQLWQALRASVAIPGVFPPLSWAGHQFVDGGLMCNVPCHALPPRRTLVLLVHTCARPSGGATTPYATRVWESLMGAAQLGVMRALPAYTTSCIPCVPTPSTPDAYMFGASDAAVDALVLQGARSVGVLMLGMCLLLAGCACGLEMKSKAAGAKASGSVANLPVRASRRTSAHAT